MSLILAATADPDVRLTLRRLYDHLEYSLIETADSEECLAIAAEQHLDLIIVDSDLPEADSFTLSARLFASTRAPIVMIIPDDLQVAETAFSAGATDVIIRPVHLTTLHHRLSHLLRVGEVDVLLQQEEWHRSIVENALGAIYRSTADGRFLFVNQTMVDMLGYDTADEVLALRIPEDIFLELGVRESLKDELEDGRGLDSLEGIWKKKNGQPIHVSIHARVIRDLQGQPLYYEGIVFDITRRKHVEAAEREQRRLAEALRDSAAILNSVLDTDEVLDSILLCVRRVLQDKAIDIFLIEAGVARCVRHFGYAERGVDHIVDQARFIVDETQGLREMAVSQRPLIINDVSAYSGWSVLEGFDWIKSYMGAPIRLGGHVIGYLQANCDGPNAFTRSDAEALQAFADQAGSAIHNARLYEAVRRHAEQLEQRVAERTVELDLQRIQLQTILESMNEGVMGVLFEESPGKVAYRYLNQSLYNLFGYSAAEWDPFALKPDDMSNEHFNAIVMESRQTSVEQGIWKGDLRLQAKNGQVYQIALTVTRVAGANGKIIGSVSVFRDITKEKALDAQKARFVASAAHELRTPLTSLKTRIYLAEVQPQQMDKHLKILDRVTDQMQKLIDDLLDLSRFENGFIMLRHEPIELKRFIKSILEIQAAEAERKGIHLVTDLSLTALQVEGDGIRINQVISNLLTNAMQHTDAGGQITIRLRLQKPDGGEYDQALIQVEDTGAGIEAEHLSHIFEPFYQANKGSGRGMGLGLSISNEIVELHGGKLTVESKVGKGTCFSVWLPLQAKVS